MEAVYEFDPAAELIKRRTCTSTLPYDSTQSQGQGGLCRTCQHNQTVLIQLMASFDPPESSGSFEKLANQYRRDLERRYPLCSSCKYTVDQRLHALTLRLKSKKLAGAKPIGAHSKLSQLRKQDERTSISLAGIFCVFIHSSSGLLDLFIHSPHMQKLLEKAQYYPTIVGHLEGIEFEKYLLTINYTLGMVEYFAGVVSGQGYIWSALLTLMLTALRLSSMPEHLGSFAKVFITLIHLKLVFGCKIRSRRRNTEFEQRNLSVDSVPLSQMEPPMSKRKESSTFSPSKTIANDLMDLDWGLGESIQNNAKSAAVTPRAFAPPISTSLPGTENKRFLFAPSKLDPSKAVASMFNTPTRDEKTRAFPQLKPSILQVDRPSGLESAFGGFSFSEKAPALTIQSVSSVNLTEIGLTCLFIGFRIFVKDKLLLIALILAASFLVRGYIWTQIPQHARHAITSLAIFRFAFLAGQLTEPDFYSLTVGPLWIRLVNLLLDLAILAVR